MFNTVNILLQRFVTDYLGIAAATWGAVYLATKLYDAVTDPVMGIVSDRTRSPWGRRRPYLLVGGIICALAFYGLFHAPSVTDSNHVVLILVGLMILYSTGYTIFNVPYMAMPAEMTDDYHERSFLVSFRVYAIGLGTIAGIAVAPYLIKQFGGGREGHQTLALVYSFVIATATLVCFLSTRNGPTNATGKGTVVYATRTRALGTIESTLSTLSGRQVFSSRRTCSKPSGACLLYRPRPWKRLRFLE